MFRRGPSEDDEQVARNVSPFTVEPGSFTYRLVRGELDFADYGTVVAHCRIDRGPWHLVPFTLLPPVEPVRAVRRADVPFAAALSEHPVPAVAVGEAVGDVVERLGAAPDVAVLFVTPHHVGALEDIAAAVQTLLDPTAFIGATAGRRAGRRRAASRTSPGLALWAGRLAGAVTPVHLTADQSEDGWHLDGLDRRGPRPRRLARARGRPVHVPRRDVLQRLRASHPDLPVIGGLASAARGPGGNRLVIGGRVATHGAVGLVLDGAASPSTVVSQGCRPIGQPFTVTNAERQIIKELAGRPALERLMEMVEALDPDRAGAGRAGAAVRHRRRRAERSTFDRGDFLVRGLIGADRDAGAVAVGDEVPVGRDHPVPGPRRGDRRRGPHRAAGRPRGRRGALVFTCNGRGTEMFGDAHHDAAIVHGLLGGGRGRHVLRRRGRARRRPQRPPRLHRVGRCSSTTTDQDRSRRTAPLGWTGPD